jgi:hypothetical protein
MPPTLKDERQCRMPSGCDSCSPREKLVQFGPAARHRADPILLANKGQEFIEHPDRPF